MSQYRTSTWTSAWHIVRIQINVSYHHGNYFFFGRIFLATVWKMCEREDILEGRETKEENIQRLKKMRSK